MTPPFLGVSKKSGPSFDHLCFGDVGNLGMKNVGGDCTPYLVEVVTRVKFFHLYFRGLYVSQILGL